MRTVATLTCAFLLASCGAENAQDNKGGPAPVELPEQTPVDAALSEVPPKDRRAFQKALSCEVRRNTGKAIDVNPAYIRDLKDRLKQDLTIADC